MTEMARHLIAGEWRDDGGAPEASTNPADDSVIGHFVPGNAALAEEAAQAAKSVFDEGSWAASPRLRAQAMFELADRLFAARNEIANLIVAENGKTRAEAMGEAMASVSETRYYAGLARNIRGTMQEIAPGEVSLFSREAAGVAGIIVPWNAPVTLLLRSLAPALAAGCTAVLKPAHQTPLIHQRVMRCLAECPSLPTGVVNSVNETGVEVSKAMVASPNIDVISFTGSSRTGKLIQEDAAKTLKRVGLELGGKAPALVFEDVALDSAVKELTRGSLPMAGQMCVAAARFLVHESIAKAFQDKMVDCYRAVRVGPGVDPKSDVGALIDMANQKRLMGLIEQASDEGEIVIKGRPLHEGAFLTPTLFKIDNLKSSLVQEELFGPIVSLETFADEAEAVAKANATAYGLAASVFTHDVARAMRVSRAIRAGTVWVNSHLRLFAEAETGGYGQSGLGRLHGVEGLNDFLETKHVYFESGTV